MLRLIFGVLLGTLLLLVVVVGGVAWYYIPTLPSIDILKDVRLQEPLRVYSSDYQLIAEFGEKRRTPVTLANTPDIVVKAFIAAEDEHFFRHHGVDFKAVGRALLSFLKTGEKRQGASTISMQVARNFFLTSEKSWERKIKEVLLAIRIERELPKATILELYFNKIYMGQRAYGIAAAAQVYYGKDLFDLTLAEAATLAGIPKAPSDANPVSNPVRSKQRRGYVLERMLRAGYITREEFYHANRAPETARLHGPEIALSAPHVAEMVRAYMVERYGEAVYESGLRVITTLDSRLQNAATAALRTALTDYDRRHGYRGPEGHFELPEGADESHWEQALAGYRPVGGLPPAVVLETNGQEAKVYSPGIGLVTIGWPGLSWARPYIDHDHRGPAPKLAADILKRGDIVRMQQYTEESEGKDGKDAKDSKDAKAAASPPRVAWRLAQHPAVEGALVALDPNDGSIRALVGGFDFARSKFNRVTQAYRQPGSNFKPFIYSAALDSGFTAASFVNDAPIVFDAPGLEGAWRPENFTGRYYGPTRLREALMMSRNLVSIRLLRAIGVEKAVDYVSRFGFDAGRLPHNLSLALGTGELTPLEVVRGYAVFANGGYLVQPNFIARVEGAGGEVLLQNEPPRVCHACDEIVLTQVGTGAAEAADMVPEAQRAKRVIDVENAWMITSMLSDVITHGTGQRARVLGRKDLAGKTGTTNDQKDAWFSGYNARLVATAWVGFDQVAPLGKDETGARAALPMWIDFMRVALKDMPEARLEQPPGLVTVRIDPETGLLAAAGQRNAITEAFRPEQVPRQRSSGPLEAAEQGTPEQLF